MALVVRTSWSSTIKLVQGPCHVGERCIKIHINNEIEINEGLDARLCRNFIYPIYRASHDISCKSVRLC